MKKKIILNVLSFIMLFSGVNGFAVYAEDESINETENESADSDIDLSFTADYQNILPVSTKTTDMKAESSTDQTICTNHYYANLLKVVYENIESETEWASDNEAIVTVFANMNDSASASVTGVSVGTAKITATCKEDPSLSVVFEITVNNVPPAEGYTTSFGVPGPWGIAGELDDPLIVNYGETQDIMVLFETKSIAPQRGAFENPAFVVSDVVKIDSYQFKGGASGSEGMTMLYTVTLSAKASGKGTLKIGNGTINVEVPEAAEPEDLSITVYGDMTLTVGSELQLYGEVIPENADQTLVWESSNEKIATVDQTGLVKGLKTGEVTITITAVNGMQVSMTLRVLFTDVPAEGEYYSKPVYWAVDKGITNGYTDADGLARTFGPKKSCTREAVVTFLWRLAGKPNPKSMTSKFKDVQDQSKYYYKAVMWAAEKGITGGYADGTFRPDATCLREHVVTFLWRYAGKPTVNVANPFNDIKTSDYYYMAVLWANKNGIANGYSTGEYKGGFGPKLDCLREHVVTFLYRYAK